jgi:hypothetical protein
MSVGQHHTKICENLSNSKNLVFSVIKLLNESLDLMLWLSGRKKRCEQNEGQALWS